VKMGIDSMNLIVGLGFCAIGIAGIVFRHPILVWNAKYQRAKFRALKINNPFEASLDKPWLKGFFVFWCILVIIIGIVWTISSVK